MQHPALAELTLSGFDFVPVREMVGDDDELIIELLLILLESLPTQLEQMIELIEKRELSGAAALAHGIKGVAGNVGAITLANSAIALEASLKKGMLDHAATAHFQQIMQQTHTQLTALL